MFLFSFFAVSNGERLTSFLVIATAKQVLMKVEPNLLNEYGGSVSLDLNWAKSFMRRHTFKDL